MPVIKANLTGRFILDNVTRPVLPMSSSIVGYMQGISLGGPTTMTTEGTFQRNMQVGFSRNDSEGSRATPCIELIHPGMFSFRWVVRPGQRRISIRTKQIKSYSGQRPTMKIKKNVAVGLTTDTIITAPEGTDWVLLGPYVFTAQTAGVLIVELWNNLQIQEAPVVESKAFFDHIAVS